MKKSSMYWVLAFVLLVSLGLAANLIAWDETPLEQTIWGMLLGFGFMTELPVFFVEKLLVPENFYIDYDVRAFFYPIISALFYTLGLYGLTRLARQLKATKVSEK